MNPERKTGQERLHRAKRGDQRGVAIDEKAHSHLGAPRCPSGASSQHGAWRQLVKVEQGRAEELLCVGTPGGAVRPQEGARAEEQAGGRVEMLRSPQHVL